MMHLSRALIVAVVAMGAAAVVAEASQRSLLFAPAPAIPQLPTAAQLGGALNGLITAATGAFNGVLEFGQSQYEPLLGPVVGTL